MSGRISIARKSSSQTSLTLRVGLSEASKSRSSDSSRACPPPNCALGSAAPTTGLIVHSLDLLIVYSRGLNQHGIWPPPSISMRARSRPRGAAGPEPLEEELAGRVGMSGLRHEAGVGDLEELGGDAA